MGTRFTGMNELTAKLKRSTDMNPFKRAIQQNATEMQTKAQRNAPIDTGSLKASIHMETADAGMTVELVSTGDYAPYLEFGTRFKEAQPYMKPAFNEQKEKFRRDLDRLMK